MEIKREIERFLDEWNDDKDYIAAHTSGSTGTPKEIRLLKEDMRRSAQSTIRFFSLSSASRIGAALSHEYIAGKMMVVRSIEASCALEIIKPEMSPEIEVEMDLLAIVPAQIEGVIPQKNKVKNLLVGGAPLTADQRKILVESGIKGWESYGMTETCSHVAIRQITRDEGEPFIAMPSISFSKDERGCLVIHSDAFSWKVLRTNDCVDLIDRMSFRWLGRYDNVINSGGIKIFPEQLEKEYAPAIPGRRFFVTSLPDKTWGQAIVLVVEGEEIQGLKEALSSLVANRKHLPKKILYKTKLDETPNGKIIRSY